MRILDAEIKLRDATREVEQLRSGDHDEPTEEDSSREGKEKDASDDEAASDEDVRTIAVRYSRRAADLADRQEVLAERTLKVVKSIAELPRALEYFPREMALLTRVGGVMAEATEILDEPETGRRAIAAETEAIELLLQTKRVMGGGGGGGGNNPGGGGSGTTNASALALIGKGVNPKGEFGARSVNQQTGKTGRKLPEEFRRGLDRFLSLPLNGDSSRP